MKAVQTWFDGIHFRSRLEARWAVFFDALGIHYCYEAEGFDFNGVQYLPDFFLPKHDFYIEVKGEVPTTGEREMADMLAVGTGKPVFIFYGDIPHPRKGPKNDSAELHLVGLDGLAITDSGYQWTQCKACMSVDISWGGSLLRMKHEEWCVTPCNIVHPQLGHALNKARSARFEFGDTPTSRLLNSIRDRDRED